MRNLPAGFDLPLMDPINLLWWAPGSLFGGVFAYNLAVIGNLAVAALGGWMLAHELTGSRSAALVGMVATAFSPFLSGVIEFGITESWPVGWVAIHAALLLRYARTGSLRSAVGASLALAAVLLSGWYHAFFALVAEVGLGVWALAIRPRFTTIGVLVAQGLVALAPVLPRLWATARAAMGRRPLSGVGYHTTARPRASGDITVQPLSISGLSLSVAWRICSIRFGARDRLTVKVLAPDWRLFTE